MASRPPAGWRPTKLAAVSDLLAGFAFKSKEFSDGPEDIRLLRGDNIGQGCLRWNSARRWPADRAAEVTRYALAPDDVVLAMDRPWIEAGLKFARVLPSDLPALLVQRVCRLRGHSKALDQRYLAAIIGSPTFERYVQLVTTGSAVPHISGSDIAQFAFDLPPLSEQASIVVVLRALDDKIESNRRTANAARTVLMQAPPSTGESSPLDQAADFHNGGALTKHATGSGRPILRIRELRAGVTADTPRTDAPVRETHEVAAGDLLFSWSGTLLTTRWCGEPAVLNQHVFRVDSRPGLSRWFVEAWIERHLNTFRAIAADKATTMGHIQRHHLSVALVALPPHDEIDALMRTYDPLDHLRMSLLAEADRLIAIRDALLPRLVSGRIRVPLTQEPEAALDMMLDVAAETSMRVA